MEVHAGLWAGRIFDESVYKRALALRRDDAAWDENREPGRLPNPVPACLLMPAAMQVTETVQCPFCGQTVELNIDTTVAKQRFVTDCEVCCRPFEVVVECEPGEVLSVS